MKCTICGCGDSKIIYQGRIRDGAFGNYTAEDISIYQCQECGVIYHENTKKDEFYKSVGYRESMGEKIGEYEILHDKEVLDKFRYTGTDIFRNRIIADIGCAGGSFLDFIQGAALETVGIEPTAEFRKVLKKKGHLAYAYAADALGDYRNRTDIVTSFDVIEHVEDPFQFMRECYELLREGGTCIAGTPTEQPVMRMALGEEYDQFLFSTQHLWIFNEESLRRLAEQAGFQNVKVKYYQRYGLGNLISWLKYHKPMGNVKCEYVSDTVDKAWIINSEERKLADYLVIYAEK